MKINKVTIILKTCVLFAPPGILKFQSNVLVISHYCTGLKERQFDNLSVNQQKRTIRQSHSNVIIRQLLHVSGLTGPSSGSAQNVKKTSFASHANGCIVSELNLLINFIQAEGLRLFGRLV